MSRGLGWDGVPDARDFGEWITSDGWTKPDAVMFAGSLAEVSAAGVTAIRAAGIRTFVELATAYEAPTVPHAIRRAPELLDGIFHVRAPIDDPSDELWRLLDDGEHGEATWLRVLIEVAPARVVRAVQVIADAPGGVLVHASAGRDRPGIVRAILQTVAGVAPASIAAELVPDAGADAAPSSRAAMRGARRTRERRSAFELALDGFDAAAWLAEHGVTPDELAALRARLVVASDESWTTLVRR